MRLSVDTCHYVLLTFMALKFFFLFFKSVYYYSTLVLIAMPRYNHAIFHSFPLAIEETVVRDIIGFYNCHIYFKWEN